MVKRVRVVVSELLLCVRVAERARPRHLGPASADAPGFTRPCSVYLRAKRSDEDVSQCLNKLRTRVNKSSQDIEEHQVETFLP